MKGLTDCNPPAFFNHPKSRAKKDQLLEDKYVEIERQNKILLKKVQHIIKGSPSVPNLQPIQVSQPIKVLTSEEKKSLNKDYRKRELLKITLENYELLRRINKNKSSYNILKWEEEFKRKEKLMRSMSEFPQFYDEREKTVSLKKQEKIYKLPDIVEMQQSASKFNQNTVRMSSENGQSKTNFNTAEPQTNHDQLRSNMSSTKQHKKKYKIHEQLLVKLTHNQDIANEESRQFQINRRLAGELYQINIFRTLEDIIYVSAFNEKSSEMFLIELPKPKSLEVLVSFDNDYHRLCDHLDIQKGRLVILNPNRKLAKKTNPKTRLQSLNKQPSPRKNGITDTQQDNHLSPIIESTAQTNQHRQEESRDEDQLRVKPELEEKEFVEESLAEQENQNEKENDQNINNQNE